MNVKGNENGVGWSPEFHNIVPSVLVPVVECWVIPDAQVHSTVSLTLMVTVCGTKTKFVTITLAVAAEAGNAGANSKPANPHSNGNIGYRNDLFIFIEPDNFWF